jgi:hypothetical protein
MLVESTRICHNDATVKWFGLALMLLGGIAFAVLAFLGILWFEPPIEAPWVIEPSIKTNEVQTGKLTEPEYWFEVGGLGARSNCSLVATGAGGREVFREEEKQVSNEGCRRSYKPSPGESLKLQFSPAGHGEHVKAYMSHGDGFPHIGKLLAGASLAFLIGVVLLVVGIRRKVGARAGAPDL